MCSALIHFAICNRLDLNIVWLQGRVYAPGESEDSMAQAIKEFNDFVIKDDRVEVVALPFRDGVNIVQRRYQLLSKLDLLTMETGLYCCLKIVRGCSVKPASSSCNDPLSHFSDRRRAWSNLALCMQAHHNTL